MAALKVVDYDEDKQALTLESQRDVSKLTFLAKQKVSLGDGALMVVVVIHGM